MSWRTPVQLKDVLVEHISRDIKELQKLQSTVEPPSAAVPSSSPPVYSLCEHLDHVMMHGLRDYRPGYWPFVRNFSRKDIIRSISDLTQVNTDVGRGRVWLFTALNEQVFGSYLRLFLENQQSVSNFYYKEAFLHDTERLLLLDTLVSGLDFVIFNLTLNEGYLDYAASVPSATLGKRFELPSVEPSFISKASHMGTHPVAIPATSRVKTQEELSVSFAEGYKGHAEGKEPWQTQSLGPGKQISASERLPREPMPLPLILPTISEVKGNTQKVEQEEEDEDDLVVHQRKSKTKRKKKKSKTKLQGDGDQGSPPEGKSQKGSPPENKEQALNQKGAGSVPRSKPSPHENSPPSFQKPSDLDNHQRPPVKNSSPILQHTSVVISSSPQAQTTISAKSASPTLQQRTSTSSLPKIQKSYDVSDFPHAQKQVSTNPFDDKSTPAQTTATSKPVNEPGVSASTNRPVQPVSSSGTKPVQPIGLGTRPEQPVGLGSKPVQAVGSSTKPVQIIDQNLGTKPVDQPSSAIKPVQPVDQPSSAIKPVQPVDGSSLAAKPVWQPSPVGVANNTRPSPVGMANTTRMLSLDEVDGGTRHLLSGGGEDLQSEFRKRSPHIFEHHGSSEGADSYSGCGSPDATTEPVVKATTSHGYDNLVITEADKHVADIRVDSNTQLVLSLDVMFSTEEKAHQERLVQVHTPYGTGLSRTAYVLVTNIAVYILKKDGAEGHYCREVGIHYKDFEYIVVGLDWQSLVLVYTSKLKPREKYVLLTGSEAVSRSITESIQLAVKECPDYKGSVALNKEDEMRVEAIEKELIKLGSHTSMDIVKYSLVNWEQLKGDAPKIAMATSSPKMGGLLQYKNSLFNVFLHQWKTGYFKLRNTHLCLYNNEQEDVVKTDWDLKGKSIMRAAPHDNKPYAISITAGSENVLVLAASSEEEYAVLMSGLCEAAIGQERDSRSSQYRSCVPCALLLTTNQIHVLQEDWSNETVRLITSCEITDVCDISTDSEQPFYCTIRYHSGTTHQDTVQGVWLVYFSSEYELGKFVAAVTRIWKAEMQIDLSLSNVEDSQIRDRAHRAVELMLSSKWRSDSVTRGRSEHI